MKTCFSIMPFGAVFDEIDEIIAAAAHDCGLEYVRGDRLLRPGSILPQILRQIQHATVIVADITGHNPNVFYELGIAHQVRGTERVVILTADKTSPYDVHEFRQLVYTNNRAGWKRLSDELPLRIREAAESAEREVWSSSCGSFRPSTSAFAIDRR